MAALLQYVHDLQQLSLPHILLSDKLLLSLWTRVRSSDTDTSLQSVSSGAVVLGWEHSHNIANLISKLNFYKLIPYPMDNCFTGRCDRSCQMPEKDVLYILLAGLVTECAFARGRIILSSCLDSVRS